MEFESIWDVDRLFERPSSRAWPPEFNGEATPVMVEGEPYEGRQTWCFAYYGVPDWATPENPAPGIVLVHGGQGTAYPEWVRMWVRRGYAAICVDTCGALPVRTGDVWMRNPDGGPAGWGRIERSGDPVRDQWVYHAVAAAIRSHSFLRSLPGVDPGRIGCTGISWGGFLSCILSAVDTRLKFVVPVYGCAFVCERTGWIGKFEQTDIDRWGRLWDPSHFLSRTRCPMLWVDGTNDFAFPLADVRRSAALALVPHVFSTHLRMVHGHGEPGEGPREILAFADYMLRGGADVVRVGECRFDGGCVEVRIDSGKRKLGRVELLWTADGADVQSDKRLWESTPVEKPASGEYLVAVPVPSGAKALVVNAVTTDGLVFSSPYTVVPESIAAFARRAMVDSGRLM